LLQVVFFNVIFLPPVRLFMSAEQKQFLRPATGVCPVKSDALCEAEGGCFFIHIFGGFRKPPKIWAFFPD